MGEGIVSVGSLIEGIRLGRIGVGVISRAASRADFDLVMRSNGGGVCSSDILEFGCRTGLGISCFGIIAANYFLIICELKVSPESKWYMISFSDQHFSVSSILTA